MEVLKIEFKVKENRIYLYGLNGLWVRRDSGCKSIRDKKRDDEKY